MSYHPCIGGHSLYIHANPKIGRVLPYPKAKYYRYTYVVECSRCHCQFVKYAKTVREREQQMSAYQTMPVFPH